MTKTFKPQETRRWEAGIADAFAKALGSSAIVEGPVAVYIVSILPRPEERRKFEGRGLRKRIRFTPYRHWDHDYKPDVDNVRKLTQDAVKHFWKDDKQVVFAVDGKLVAAFDERAFVQITFASVTPKHFELLFRLTGIGRRDVDEARCTNCGRLRDAHRGGGCPGFIAALYEEFDDFTGIRV